VSPSLCGLHLVVKSNTTEVKMTLSDWLTVIEGWSKSVPEACSERNSTSALSTSRLWTTNEYIYIDYWAKYTLQTSTVKRSKRSTLPAQDYVRPIDLPVATHSCTQWLRKCEPACDCGSPNNIHLHSNLIRYLWEKYVKQGVRSRRKHAAQDKTSWRTRICRRWEPWKTLINSFYFIINRFYNLIQFETVLQI